MPDSSIPTPLAELVREIILRTLERCEGNVKQAAQELGIGKTTVYRKLKEYKRQEVGKTGSRE